MRSRCRATGIPPDARALGARGPRGARHESSAQAALRRGAADRVRVVHDLAPRSRARHHAARDGRSVLRGRPRRGSLGLRERIARRHRRAREGGADARADRRAGADPGAQRGRSRRRHARSAYDRTGSSRRTTRSRERAVAEARSARHCARHQAQADAEIDYTTIEAPFDGVVTLRTIDPGDMVYQASSPKGKAEPLLRVAKSTSSA